MDKMLRFKKGQNVWKSYKGQNARTDYYPKASNSHGENDLPLKKSDKSVLNPQRQ